jgi:glutamine synthetase
MARPRLRLLFCDHLNIARGKYLPAEKMEADGASRLAQALYGVHFDRDLLPAPGCRMMEGAPDMQAVYRKTDIRAGWESDTNVVVGDLQQWDGSELPMCGRSALKRAVNDWDKMRFSVKLMAA